MKLKSNRSREFKSNIYMSLQQSTLLMLVMILSFFCIMFVLATSIISKGTENDFKKRTTETAVNNVASSIKASLGDYNYLSRLIMINRRVVDYLKAEEVGLNLIYEARSGVYEIQTLFSFIDSVYIFRNDNEFVSTGKGEYIVNLNSDELNNIMSAKGSTVISINGNGTMMRANGEPLLTMSRAIYDINSQKLLGMLVMNISCQVFKDAIDLQSTDGMCVLGSDGTFLCGDSDIINWYSKDFHSESIVYKNIRFEEETKILSGKIAVDPVVVMCVSGKGAKVLPRDTIYALIITLFAFIISIAVCAWFITVNITKPIKNLSEAMKRTRSSGWLKKIDTEMPGNEIGRLAENYNTMIEYLNELFNRLLENEKNVQKAEMRVLQEQIKPHFLYNTLETISYMAVMENAGKVHDALEILGNFYRNFLSKGDREIPLKRELRITQDYLSLQKLRYEDIFEDEYSIDDSTLDFMVPKLILQPLVENAIYHGIRLKGEKGIIRISTRMKNDGVYITVYDTGVGMSEEQIQKVIKGEEEGAESLSGFGLCGTINRIRYYCDCKDVVEIKSEPGEYTEIEVFISKKKEVNEQDHERLQNGG